MAHAHKGGISHSPRQRFAAPKQRYAPPEWWFAPVGGFFPPPSKIENRRLLIKKKPAKRYEHLAGLREEDAAESNRVESAWAISNSAAENATRGPRCSVFFPSCQKTRLWGLSGRLGVTGKARKRAAKREKRQKSPQWGPECHTGPMQRGPLSAFSAILRTKPRNRRFPQRKIC